MIELLAPTLGLALGMTAAAPAPTVSAEESACSGKTAGAACTHRGLVKSADGPTHTAKTRGTCVDDECCTLDYSKGSPPQSVCRACVICRPGGSAAASGGPAGDEAGDKAEAGGDEADRPGDVPPAATPTARGRGCTVGARPSRGAAWWAVWALALVRVRRRTAP